MPFTRTCALESCQTQFTRASSKVRYCSNRCAAIQRQIDRGLRWRDAELNLLHELVGQVPLKRIISRVQSLERRNDWPVRSDAAIKKQLKCMKLSVVCSLDHLTCAELARTLDITPHRIYITWIKQYNMPAQRLSRSLMAVSLQAFRQWAIAHPKCLVGVNIEGLRWLFNDQNIDFLVRQIPDSLQGLRKPVRHVETGQTFPTIAAASAALPVSAPVISKALQQDGMAYGIQFEPVPSRRRYGKIHSS